MHLVTIVRLFALFAISLVVPNFEILAGPLHEHVEHGGDPDEYLDSLGNLKELEKDPSGEFRGNLGGGAFNESLGTDAAARAVVIQTNGRFVLGGRARSGSYDDWALLRFHIDGSVDTSFATDGSTLTSFGSNSTSDETLHALLLQSDGKIVGVGRGATTAGVFFFAAARYTPTGELDTSFYTSGKSLYDVGASVDFARTAILDSEGRFVLGGFSKNGALYEASALRLGTDGGFDTTFATSGKKTFALSSSDNGFLGSALDTNGTMIFTGNSYNGSDFDVSTARLVSDGTLDTSFDTNGIGTYSVLSSNDSGFGLFIDRNGFISIAASSYNGSDFDFALLRLQTSGNFDTTFHTDGKVTTAITTGAGSGNDYAYGIFVQTDQKIWAAGYTTASNNQDFAFARYSSDGILDSSFHTDGMTAPSLSSTNDVAQAFSFRSDHFFVAAGRAVVSGDFNFSLLRMQTNGSLAKSGDLVLSWGTAGSFAYDISGTDNYRGYGMQTDGRMFWTGDTSSTPDFVIVAFNGKGTFDTTFSTDGLWSEDVAGGNDVCYKVTQQLDGKLLAWGSDATIDYVLMRLATDGLLDTSFHTDGKGSYNVAGGDNARACFTIDTSGRYLGCGSTNNQFGIIRVLTNGTIDTTFSSNGKHNVAFSGSDAAVSIEVEVSGRIFMAGSGANDFEAIRLSSDGVIDTTFHTDGKAAADVTTSEVTRNGVIQDNKYILSGQSGAATEYGIVRLQTDGTFDTSFMTSGAGVVDVTANDKRGGVAITDSNRYFGNVTDGNDFYVVRMLTSGALDTTFATSGKSAALSFGAADTSGDIIIRPDGIYCQLGVKVSTDLAAACYWP